MGFFMFRYSRMKNLLTVLICAVLLNVAGTVNAGRPDPVTGEAKAKVVCAPCHGPVGISLVRNYPNLAGQKEKYLIAQLEAFRTGTRVDPIAMGPISAILTDQEIKDLAAYYSELNPAGDLGG
jgi:cytochrome c553